MLNKRFSLLLNGMLMLSGCKYEISLNTDAFKLNCPTIQFYSYDPYGYITTIIKERLHMNHISYTNYKQNIKYKESPCVILCITHVSEKCIKTALFQNGESAEYQLILTVTAKIKMKNNEYHLFKIKTFKSFFNNPMTISQNFVKKNDVRKTIYEETAEKLINKLLFVIKNN